MKAIEIVAWMAILPISALAACSWVEGKCHLRGAQGGSDGVGGSVLPPGGAGGYGDEPGNGEQQCEQSDPGPTELNQVICSPAQQGTALCAEECALNGAPCAPTERHPNKSGIARGKLWTCCGCTGKRYCGYVYDNGDVCKHFLDTLPEWLCNYPGGG